MTSLDLMAAERIDDEVAAMRRAMLEGTGTVTAPRRELREIRYRNSERAEEFSRAVLQSLPCLHTNGTTSNVWPPAQAFAMLGGYRPDRHGPWINPAWVSAIPIGPES